MSSEGRVVGGVYTCRYIAYLSVRQTVIPKMMPSCKWYDLGDNGGWGA